MAKFSYWQHIQSQWMWLPPVHHVDLSGQTVVVTGSNIGLGLETVKHLARMNPENIILAVRSTPKGEAVIPEIRDVSRYTGNTRVMTLDQADFASVSAFVTEFEQSFERLDVLIANAGIGRHPYEKTKDGWETILQVNQLGAALLSLLLLPRMLQTAKKYITSPRLTVVSSGAVFLSTMIEDLHGTPKILEKLSSSDYYLVSVMGHRYHDTKLLNLLFVRALTEHLPPSSSLVANAVGPGYCQSGFSRNSPRTFARWLMEVLLRRRGEEGAKVIVWAALAGSSPAEPIGVRESLRGVFSEDCMIKEESDAVLSIVAEKTQEKIWKETLTILSAADPRIERIAEQYLTA